ncbi:MAG: hypothetical protein HRU20_22615 [Pseudomonadales bacterium]|nr:hypothetical protein [Pseudomonadales bacterium]
MHSQTDKRAPIPPTISNQSPTLAFIENAKQMLCIVCPEVNQLYSNYQVQKSQDNRQLIIAPDLDAHLDTFNDIDQAAVKMTSLIIFPLFKAGKQTLYLGQICKSTGKIHTSPFSEGIMAVKNKHPDFLPVLNSAAVHKIKPGVPMLKIYHLQLQALSHCSTFIHNDIRNTISYKLLQGSLFIA